MTHLGFYLHYAVRNIWRSRRWAIFAMLSVAAGVATVVALRSLGLSIADSLTENVRATNRGDILLVRSSGPAGLSFGSTSEENVFNDVQVASIRAWAADADARVIPYSTTNMQIRTPDQPLSAVRFMVGILIDPATYPPVGEVIALEPDGVPLQRLMAQGERSVVISDNLAAFQDIAVGDQVQFAGSDVLFTVRGIVPTETEAGLRDLFAAFFGFVYFDQAEAGLLNLSTQPNRISVLLPEGTTSAEIQVAASQLNRLLGAAQEFTSVRTVPNILEQNELIGDVIGRFVVIMGLGAMLIGGVGIINTMLVMVRRRTDEIATLKTFGLKGRQIAALFMTEAMLYGIIGSIIGAIVGVALSRLTLAYGETFIQQSLAWRFYPEAMLFGLGLGVIVSAVFGVMPVLTAVKVRPTTILRPNENAIPALGIAQSLGVVAFVVLTLGLIAGQIIGPLPVRTGLFAGFILPQHLVIGILLVAATLLVLAALTGFLWVVIGLVSRLPSFGSVELSLALKNLRVRRLRTATTLLAISTGIFAISGITLYGAGAREVLQIELTRSFGGNVLIITPSSFALDDTAADNAQRVLNETLDSLGDAVTYRSHLLTYDGRLNAVDATLLRDVERDIDREAMFEEINTALRQGDLEEAQDIADDLDEMITPVEIYVQETTNPDMRSGDIYRGRDLTPEDAGRGVAVVLMDDRMIRLGVDLGSDVVVEVQGQEAAFEVVGLIRDTDQIGGDAGGTLTIPSDTLPWATPEFQLNSVMAPPDRIAEVESAIAGLPFYFSINVNLLDDLVDRVITQFSALPLLVAILSLVAAGVIMANTVALATFERRRQIGILKAIGLKRRRVLLVMALENVIISLLGAALGLVASVIAINALSLIGLEMVVFVPSDARPVALLLILASVSIGLTATLLSTNSAVRERVLNVLRYE